MDDKFKNQLQEAILSFLIDRLDEEDPRGGFEGTGARKLNPKGPGGLIKGGGRQLPGGNYTRVPALTPAGREFGPKIRGAGGALGALTTLAFNPEILTSASEKIGLSNAIERYFDQGRKQQTLDYIKSDKKLKNLQAQKSWEKALRQNNAARPQPAPQPKPSPQPKEPGTPKDQKQSRRRLPKLPFGLPSFGLGSSDKEPAPELPEKTRRKTMKKIGKSAPAQGPKKNKSTTRYI